jgi:hypothetical protein
MYTRKPFEFFARNACRINTSGKSRFNPSGINTSKSPRITFILNDFNPTRINTSEKLRSNSPRINTSKNHGGGYPKSHLRSWIEAKTRTEDGANTEIGLPTPWLRRGKQAGEACDERHGGG